MHPDTPRHLRHASGYLALDLRAEAAAELAAIAPEDRDALPVLSARLELAMAAHEWEAVIGLARTMATQAPAQERGWICWAYALRELQRVAEARDVLLGAEPIHGEQCALLHYNLACYYCLLGQPETAQAQLNHALRLDPALAAEARRDPDLTGLRSQRT